MTTILCPQGLSKMYRLAVATGLVLFAGLVSAFAAEPLKVTVHQSYLVQLQQDADIIMVGNPTIADIAVESARMFFLLGLEPGETSLHVLNSRGETIVQTAVVVTPTAERTVTVNRANNLEEATYSCAPRCAAVGTAVGVGAAPPTGGGDEDSAEDAASITGGSEETTTESATGG
jgi:hypothetical protein